MSCSGACDTVWANNIQGTTKGISNLLLSCPGVEEAPLSFSWMVCSGVTRLDLVQPFWLLDEGHPDDDIGVQRRPEWRKSGLAPDDHVNLWKKPQVKPAPLLDSSLM